MCWRTTTLTTGAPSASSPFPDCWCLPPLCTFPLLTDTWLLASCRHAEALAEKLMRAGSVKHLDLSHNRLSWVAISNIAEMLTARPSSFGGNQTKLTSLTVRHSRPSSAPPIFDSQSTCKSTRKSLTLPFVAPTAGPQPNRQPRCGDSCGGSAANALTAEPQRAQVRHRRHRRGTPHQPSPDCVPPRHGSCS